MINRYGLMVLTGLAVLGNAGAGVAMPADVFLPHLDRIRQTTPPNTVMRLPATVLLGGPGSLNPNELLIRVLPTSSPPRMTVSLFTCASGPFPCLVGSFTAENAGSVNAQRELSRHQLMATPITLTPGVQGFLLEGTSQTPPSDFSSVMWQQDDTVYTVSFLAAERQNILFMAASMAKEEPLQTAQAQRSLSQ
ncbi:hypothetical protein IQ268_00120 [Oculatella sp. LEGE 06141]|uniref:hypothetical protein n=1 Tax=Oculatella sp. LEGE 06141 TaxID=1828648 RepID=UPI0018817999|nr:hypothetical protein [Oculatella sp. LEGE 06141]MBE9176981.1 hypothetical protein [Oculatella sp. LEGE 06141]